MFDRENHIYVIRCYFNYDIVINNAVLLFGYKYSVMFCTFFKKVVILMMYIMIY